MAVNKNPWLRNDGGDSKPMIVRLRVQAGSTQAIKRGEICIFNVTTANVAVPISGTSEVTHLIVANEEQKADDVARYVEFIVPRPNDLFECEMSAARQVMLGETFCYSTSQKLAYSTSNVIFRSADDSNYPAAEEKSTTVRSVGYVRGYFDEQTSLIADMTGNS